MNLPLIVSSAILSIVTSGLLFTVDIDGVHIDPSEGFHFSAPKNLDVLFPSSPSDESSFSDYDITEEPRILPLSEVNEDGRIPILEYHSVGPQESRWMRSVENFKKDLEWLYNNDYVLLSIEDYAKSYFPIPYGKKPVVITFDDGNKYQFRYREDGSIDPDCAIGILDDFYMKHPDFGSAVVFYVNNNPFSQPEFAAKKIEYLYKTGRQIGYHTLYHEDLRAGGYEYTLSLLRKQDEILKDMIPDGMTMTTIAYPHGWGPVGDRSGLSEKLTVGLLIGADPAYPLYSPKANAYRTPRIQAIDEEWLRHFARQPGETARSEKKEKFKVFVSDGSF